MKSRQLHKKLMNCTLGLRFLLAFIVLFGLGQQQLNAQHFQKVFAGNPLNPMTFMITHATLAGENLEAGDEVGIFDGEYCVGVSVLTQVIDSADQASYLSVACGQDDPGTQAQDGFVNGNTITYKLWDQSENKESSVVNHFFQYAASWGMNHETFGATETCVVGLNGFLSINTTIPDQIFCDDGSLTEITVPIMVAGMDAAYEIDLGLNYETTHITYSSIGMQNAVFDGDPITVSDNAGLISITWSNTTDSAFIENDTLLTLVFTKNSTGDLEFTWEASSAYRDFYGNDKAAEFSGAYSYLVGNPEITAVTPTDISCNGSNDGSIDITATASTLIDYSIDNGGNWARSQNVFDNLSGGDYTVIVADTFGCQDVWANNPVLITDPAALSFDNVATTNVTGCFNNNNGSIDITVSGGTGTKQYSIDDGTTWQSGSGLFENLVAGDYTLKVKDANDCSADYVGNPVTITSPDPIVLDPPTVVDVTTCAGNTNGSISLSATGGAGGLQYSIDAGSNWQATGLFENLAAGEYTVQVKDVQDCVLEYASNPVVVAEPDSILITAVVLTDLSCNGIAEGSIEITASGGTGDLNYSIDNGATYQLAALFENLAAGQYNIILKDANNCEMAYASNPVEITEPTVITKDTVIAQNVSCNGADDASITIECTGGTGSLVYSVDDGATWDAGTGVFENLTPGDYTLKAKDENDCMWTYANNPLTITQPDELLITNVTPIDVQGCYGDETGSISISAGGGTAPYQYSVDNGANWQSNADFVDLAAGDYNLVVKDTNNCQEIYAANPIVISQPDELVINGLTFTKESSSGAGDATIIIDATGGTGMLSYSVDNGATWEQNGGSFTTLNGGTFNVQVKDVNGCTTIYANNPITINDPHFTKIWSGGAFNPMTVTVSSAAIDGLLMQAGDEIGIFDGDNCVGAAVLTQAIDSLNNTTYLYVTCSADDEAAPGIDGFVPGNDVDYRLWNDATQEEFIVVDDIYPYDPLFAFDVFTVNETSIVYLNGIPRILTWIEDAAVCMNDTLFAPVIARGMHEMDSAWIHIDYDTTLFYFMDVWNIHPDLGNVSFDSEDGTINIGMAADNLEFTEEKLFDLVLINQFNQTGIDTLEMSGQYTHQTGGFYVIESEFINGIAQVRELPQISDVALTDITGCFGNTNGEIDITATAETDDIYYSIDNGVNWAMNQNLFNNLAVGSYEIMVKDTFACAQSWASNPAELTEPLELEINDVASTDVTGCFGNLNGSINITAEGGTGELMYSTDNGATWQAGFAFENLAAGSYNVIVKDANDCQTVWGNNPVLIDQPEELLVSNVVSTNIMGCHGDTTATITVTATGGTGSLQYSIDNMGTWNSNNGMFDPITAGTYNVFVKDVNNCISEYGANPIIITQPDEVLITDLDAQDITGCYGNANGSITITAEGGTGLLQYSIDNGANWQNAAVFTGLTAGVYNVLVKDANDCPLDYVNNPVILTEPDGIIIDEVYAENVNCNGAADAFINILAQGGTPDLMYSIDNGGNWQLDSLFLNLTPGLYYIKVKDANNCEVTYANNPVIITQPAPLFISDVETTDLSCYNDDNGTLEITAIGGTVDYAYSIDDGATWQADNGLFVDLSAGSYDVWVKDAHDCEYEYPANPVLINQPDELIISNLDITNVSGCFGNANGEVIVTAQGGTGVYEYDLDNLGNWQSGSTITGLTAGEHIAYVRDEHLCQDTMLFYIDEPTEVIITSLTPTLPSCYGNNDGELLIAAEGGTGIFEYSVDSMNTWSSDPHFMNLGPDAYYIFVKDENDCEATYGLNPYFMPQPDSISITTVYPLNPNCYGAADGFIALAAEGGTGSFYYSIDSMATWVPYTNFDNLTAGEYYIFVKDDNDCLKEYIGNPLVLTDPEEIQFISVAEQDIICYGLGDGSIDINAEGGTGMLYYSIDGGLEWSDNGVFNNLEAGTYNLWVKDENECSIEYGSNPVVIDEADEILITIVEINDVSCFGSADGSIQLSAEGGTDTLWYSIDNGINWSLDGAFTNLNGGQYNAKVKDVAGCIKDYQNNPIVINEPDAIQIESVSSEDPLCNGNANGSIQINAQGGIGNLMYSIDNGSNWFDNNGNFQNLAAGTYYISVKDENDCQRNMDVPLVLNNPEVLSFEAVSSEAPTCAELENGSIDIDVMGGTGSLMYSIDNGENWSTSGMFEGLGNGEYYVAVKDENDCELTYASNPIVLNTMAINITEVTSEDASGSNCTDGQIVITANGGTGVLEYSVDGGSTWQSAPAFTSLLPGEYNVAVRDENNCVRQYALNPVVIEFTTNVNELANEKFSVSVYPNPSDKHFWLHLQSVDAKYRILITDISGQSIFTREYEAEKAEVTKEFNLKHLPSGTYFMHITSANDHEVVKLIFK